MLESSAGRQPARNHHVVQFYDEDDALIESVARFAAAGLRGDEPIVIIATPEHRAAFLARLARDHSDVDVAAACAIGRMVLLDARDTLARLMVDGALDRARFRDLAGGMIASLCGGRSCRIRGYGEMVDLLWRDGDRRAAIELEQQWNELGNEYAFSLLCGYGMDGFDRASDAASFHQLCATHSHVITAEADDRREPASQRLRAVIELQDRARALESELAARDELEAALRASLAQEQALRAVAERNVHDADLFAGMLGHDLRNPLEAISMGASYLARSNLGEQPTRASLRLLASAERMSRMIDQLLDVTRIRAAGGLELRRSDVDLAAICVRVVDEIAASRPRSTLALDATGDLAGHWDADRLCQVFSNLIGNAVSHGAAGQAIRIAADGSDADAVVACVHNPGAIDPELLPEIFDPFRTGNPRRGTAGLGLGLFITRQIVHAHGGDIAITSTPSDGTAVRLVLPRRPRPAPAGSDTVRVR